LRIVDDTQQRPLLRRLGKQAQHRQADEEPIRRGADAHAERNRERVALRTWEAIEHVGQRWAQLVQRDDRQIRAQPC
jgi:hypothetical protein